MDPEYFVNDRENPYTDHDDAPFSWIRGYQLGGRSLMWGRQSYRWSDLDFEANAARRPWRRLADPLRATSRRGTTMWRVHRRVAAQGEGLPQLPDGEFLPPMALNASSAHVKQAIERRFPGRTLTIGRTANPDASRQEGRARLPVPRHLHAWLLLRRLFQHPELDPARRHAPRAG